MRDSNPRSFYPSARVFFFVPLIFSIEASAAQPIPQGGGGHSDAGSRPRALEKLAFPEAPITRGFSWESCGTDPDKVKNARELSLTPLVKTLSHLLNKTLGGMKKTGEPAVETLRKQQASDPEWILKLHRAEIIDDTRSRMQKIEALARARDKSKVERSELSKTSYLEMEWLRSEQFKLLRQRYEKSIDEKSRELKKLETERAELARDEEKNASEIDIVDAKISRKEYAIQALLEAKREASFPRSSFADDSEYKRLLRENKELSDWANGEKVAPRLAEGRALAKRYSASLATLQELRDECVSLFASTTAELRKSTLLKNLLNAKGSLRYLFFTRGKADEEPLGHSGFFTSDYVKEKPFLMLAHDSKELVSEKLSPAELGRLFELKASLPNEPPLRARRGLFCTDAPFDSENDQLRDDREVAELHVVKSFLNYQGFQKHCPKNPIP